MKKPVCVVVGVGPGNGAAFAHRFADEGFAVRRGGAKPESFFVQPSDVAGTAFNLTQQPRSAWSFEVEARPFGEKW